MLSCPLASLPLWCPQASFRGLPLRPPWSPGDGAAWEQAGRSPVRSSSYPALSQGGGQPGRGSSPCPGWGGCGRGPRPGCAFCLAAWHSGVAAHLPLCAELPAHPLHRAFPAPSGQLPGRGRGCSAPTVSPGQSPDGQVSSPPLPPGPKDGAVPALLCAQLTAQDKQGALVVSRVEGQAVAGVPWSP